jgi:hypothetical protein
MKFDTGQIYSIFFYPFCSTTLNFVRIDAVKTTLDLNKKFDILPVFSTRRFPLG